MFPFEIHWLPRFVLAIQVRSCLNSDLSIWMLSGAAGPISTGYRERLQPVVAPARAGGGHGKP
jgi:hypothetical protein